MKYISCINNEKCLEWGLNLSQGCLMDLLNQLPSWANESFIDGKVYYWVSRNEVIKEIPLAYSKADTVYRHLCDLKKLGLIDYVKLGSKDMVCITQKGKEWSFRNSDLNPTLGTISDETRKSIRKSSDSNPTYKNTNNPNTKISIKEKNIKKEISVSELVDDYGVDEQLAHDWLIVRKTKKAGTLTKTAIDAVVREAVKANLNLNQAIQLSIERNWIGFEAKWLLPKNHDSPKPTPFDPVAENNKNRTSKQGGHLENEITNKNIFLNSQ